MHRALAKAAQHRAAALTPRTRPAAVRSCRCYSDSSTVNGAEPAPTYSLPQDAFDSNPTPASTGTAASDGAPTRAPLAHQQTTTSVPRRRQRQTLSNAEAQAFADLLGEIMPRTAQPTAAAAASSSTSSTAAAGGTLDLDAEGLFGIFAPAGGPAEPASSSASSSRGGISKVQQALMRKVGYKMGMQLDPAGTGKWTRKARTELTEQEELELDRLREQLLGFKSDYQVLKWGMEVVFGYDKAYVRDAMYPDPNSLPVVDVTAAAAEPQPDTTPAHGPLSRMYPDLLLLLFLVLRDTHRNPTCALSVFRLAKSNPLSYVNGCTTALYLEVLRTYWANGAGDIEAVLAGLDEMRANGVPFDDKVRELVRSIGDAIRIDQDRAELRYEREVNHSREEHELAATANEREREREIQKRRWFDANQVGAWSRMERIVEENQDEMEDARRQRDDERWHDSERARRDRFDLEREQAHRDRPDLISRGGGGASSPSSPWGDISHERSPRPRRSSNSLTVGADGLDLGAARPTWETWKVPVAERDEDGNIIMPKRPSFVNPFKIRRKGLTKEQKSAKDTRHPALWWKK
ncbi:hypothetical protein JCM3774_005507 [Rhodotorula dairenensis]